MNNKWHRRFLELAKHVSNWSKDPSTKIGAVIVNPETKIVVGMGYNGFPRGIDDSDERLNTREIKYKLVVHAEVNAVLNSNNPTKGCWIYVYPSIMKPNICPECSKVISQAGIKKVIGYKDNSLIDRWQDLSQFSNMILKESGIEYLEIEEEEEING